MEQLLNFCEQNGDRMSNGDLLSALLKSNIPFNKTTKNFICAYFLVTHGYTLKCIDGKIIDIPNADPPNWNDRIEYQKYYDNEMKYWKFNNFDINLLFTQNINLFDDSFININKLLSQHVTSNMNNCFHNAPQITDLFTPKRIEIIQEFLQFTRDCKFNSTPTTWIDVYKLINYMRVKLGLINDPIYVNNKKRKNKKPTMKANWKNVIKPEDLIMTNENYKKYVNLVEILVGRCKRMLPAVTKSLCAVYDKIGIFDNVIGVMNRTDIDFNTLLFCILTKCNFSVRKAFTLDSQIQGGLDEYLIAYFNNVICKSNTTNWNLICALLPTYDNMKNLSLPDADRMLKNWIDVIFFIKDQMKIIWENGMYGASQRNMLVPRKIDSTGWNCMVGTWNNAKRHIVVLCNVLNVPMLPIFKCMKCTAGDQMQWSGTPDPDTTVFGILAKNNIFPWSALEGKIEYDELERKLQKVCEENGVDPIKYKINKNPKLRTDNIKEHCDMICGVKVNLNTKEQMTYLKNIGIYGSTLWIGQ